MMIATSIFMLVVAGVIASNLFGLRMIELTEPKQQAAQRARELVNLLSDDIGTGWLVEVGNEDAGGFVPVPLGESKRGNALRIYYNSDTNDFVTYFQDTVSGELLRYSSLAPEAALVARGVINPLVFTGEDAAANVLTNHRTAMVIGVQLQFSELERTGTPVGPDHTYKSYEFQTRLSWRAR
ncbi:MAG: hypothetical protein KJ072_24210 [Verrucomicrobia bacterium]|nr:hypothetical protein [Verrucomicrobiota bacterium]